MSSVGGKLKGLKGLCGGNLDSEREMNLSRAAFFTNNADTYLNDQIIPEKRNINKVVQFEDQPNEKILIVDEKIYEKKIV